MPPFGFVGGTFQHPLSNVDAEQCVNWVPEILPVQAQGKAKIVFVSRPGLAVYSSAGTGPWRGGAEQNGRALRISGQSLYEVNDDGTETLRGTAGQLGTDGKPGCVVFNGPAGDQALILSAGNGFIFNLTANTLTQIADPQFPANAIQAVFWKGHFVVIPEESRTFHLSELYDGTSWATVDIGEKSNTSDYIKSILVDEDVGELFLLGTKGEVWYYDGGAGFPASPVNVIIPSGSAATFAWCLVGGSVYGLSQATEGGRVVVRFRGGYQPERISNHALEAAIQGYSEAVIASAQAFSFEWRGHRFLLLTFDDDVTWVYDETTDLWTTWDFWNADTVTSEAFLGLGHLYAFGKHLLGSRTDGTMYEVSADYLDDAGEAIRRVRRAPYIAAEGKRVRHDALTLDFQMGVGLHSGQGSSPVAMVRWSDSQAQTWSSQQEVSLGRELEYAGRAQLRRLGLAGFSGRVYEVVVTDPVIAGMVDAYVDVGRAA